MNDPQLLTISYNLSHKICILPSEGAYRYVQYLFVRMSSSEE